jgi:hypothetical protein
VEQEEPIVEYEGFKVGGSVWYLDDKGRSRWGTVTSFKMGTKSGMCALVNDSVDKRIIPLRIEQLLTSPPTDTPRARARAPRGKK